MLTVIEENDARLVQVASQKIILLKSEGIVFVSTDARELVQIGPLLNCNSI